MSDRLMFPRARKYAVVRMDPVAMVEPLQDPDASRAAGKLTPQKYLIYLEYPEDLPMPDSKWCRYRIDPIATTLRPADEDRGIESDMVMPIFPNIAHSKGRPPLTPQSDFPFRNCFHWIENSMTARVRVKPDGYDETAAVSLSITQHLALSSCFKEDRKRMSESQVEASVRSGSDSSESPLVQPLEHLPDPTDDFSWSDTDSESDLDSDDTSVPSHVPSDVADLLEMDLFGWNNNPSLQFIPLVDLWFELEEHLVEEEIPSPEELHKEVEEVVSIIKESLERRARSNGDDCPPPPQHPSHHDDAIPATTVPPPSEDDQDATPVACLEDINPQRIPSSLESPGNSSVLTFSPKRACDSSPGPRKNTLKQMMTKAFKSISPRPRYNGDRHPRPTQPSQPGGRTYECQ